VLRRYGIKVEVSVGGRAHQQLNGLSAIKTQVFRLTKQETNQDKSDYNSCSTN